MAGAALSRGMSRLPLAAVFAPAEAKRSTTNIGSEQPQMHNYGSRKARADASVLRTPTCTRAFGAEARATWVAAEPSAFGGGSASPSGQCKPPISLSAQPFASRGSEWLGAAPGASQRVPPAGGVSMDPKQPTVAFG